MEMREGDSGLLWPWKVFPEDKTLAEILKNKVQL